MFSGQGKQKKILNTCCRKLYEIRHIDSFIRFKFEVSLKRHLRKHGIECFSQNDKERILKLSYEPFCNDSEFTVWRNNQTVIDISKISLNERKEYKMIYRTLNNELPGKVLEFSVGNASNYRCSLCNVSCTQPKTGVYHLLKDHSHVQDESIIGLRQKTNSPKSSNAAEETSEGTDVKKAKFTRIKSENLARCEKCDFKGSLKVVENHMNFFHPKIVYLCGVCKQEFQIVGDLKVLYFTLKTKTK